MVSLAESLVESKASEEMGLLQKMGEELPCKVQLGIVSADLNRVMGHMNEQQMQQNLLPVATDLKLPAPLVVSLGLLAVL